MHARWLLKTLLPLGLIAAVVLVPGLPAGHAPAHAEDQAADLLEAGGGALDSDALLDQVAPPGQATGVPAASPAAAASAQLDQTVLSEIARGAPTVRAVDSATQIEAIRRAREIRVVALPTPAPPLPTPARVPTLVMPPAPPAAAFTPPPAGSSAPVQSPTPTRTASPAAATPATR